MGLAYIYDLAPHIIALTGVETANWRGATSQRRSDIAACANSKTFLVKLSGLLVQVVQHTLVSSVGPPGLMPICTVPKAKCVLYSLGPLSFARKRVQYTQKAGLPPAQVTGKRRSTS